jgi:uncharacterized protein
VVPEQGLSPEAPQGQPGVPAEGAAAEGAGALFPPPPPPPPVTGYEQASYPPPAHPQVGFEQPGHYAAGLGQPGYPQPVYDPGFPPPGYPLAVPVKTKPEPLPIEPREYHQFYRGPAFRWWKPLAGLGLFVALEFVLVLALGIAYGVWILVTGQKVSANALDIDPALLFSLNNVLVAVGLPLAVMTSWMVFRQRPRWLSSIGGGFRWQLFWPFLAIAAAGIALATLAEAALTGGFGELTWTPSSLVLIFVIVFTTPFQCAAEEYSVRGLLFRSVGSWFANRWVGLVVGIVVSSVAFMLLHGAGDPWLNAYYLLAGALFAVLAWRTGGLEASVAMHIANNLISEMLLPFQPETLAHIFDRQAGAAGPEALIQMGVTALVAGLLLWQSSRRRLPRATAPAAVDSGVAPGQA